MRTARQQLFELIATHAELVVSLGEAARDALEQAALEHPSEDRGEMARFAREWEQHTDKLVNDGRGAQLALRSRRSSSSRCSKRMTSLMCSRRLRSPARSPARAGHEGRAGPVTTDDGTGTRCGPVLSTCGAPRPRDSLRRSQRGHRRLPRDHASTLRLERQADEGLREVQAALVREVEVAGEPSSSPRRRKRARRRRTR